MAWRPRTLGTFLPFVAVGGLAGTLVGLVVGPLGFFAGMGVAGGAGAAAGWAYLQRKRRADEEQGQSGGDLGT